jgi:hypothetical protein
MPCRFGATDKEAYQGALRLPYCKGNKKAFFSALLNKRIITGFETGWIGLLCQGFLIQLLWNTLSMCRVACVEGGCQGGL